MQHPFVSYSVPLDIKLSHYLVKLGKRIFKDFDYEWIAKDLKRNLEKEIDFT